MNTITYNNYGCASLHAQECETLSGGWWPIAWKIAKIALYVIDAIDAIPEFIEGFKEGVEAAEQKLSNH